jgi:predicted Zn finger-like uncharacterized protein
MTVRLDCPECETSLAIPERARGRSVRCAVCANIFRPGGAGADLLEPLAGGGPEELPLRPAGASEEDLPHLQPVGPGGDAPPARGVVDRGHRKPAAPAGAPVALVVGVSVILGLVALLAVVILALWLAR